jgi:hypothetical protein
VTPQSLLRLYPRKWRERYGEEFVALLEQTGATPGQVMDIVRAAAKERLLPATGDWMFGWGYIAGTLVVGSLIALAANVAAFAIHARYGHLPSFNSTFSEGQPVVAYSPAIVSMLFAIGSLQWLVMLRALLSGGQFYFSARWVKVSGIEAMVWAAVIAATATADQLRMFATFGDAGFPSYSRVEIFEFSWPQCITLCLWLAMSTTRYWDAVVAARERAKVRQQVPIPPGGFLGLGPGAGA